MDINYYMKLQNAYGTKNRREKELVKVNHEMSKHFEDTFDTEDVLLNGKPFQLMIIKDTDGNTYKKKIKARHKDKFNLGDYVIWNGQYWLITLLDSDEKTWNRGYMYQCTVLLRWQNSNGEIIERWGYSEDFTKYSSGISGNNTITVGDNQYGLTLPVDDETKFLKRGIRFPIDIEGVEPPDIYKLTNRKILLTDDRAFGRGGIMTATVSYDFFNQETDKKITLPNGTQTWICDYDPHLPNSNTLPPIISDDDLIPPVESAPPVATLPLTTIKGSKILKCGYPRTYTVEFMDENDNVVDWNEIGFSWNVVSDFEIEQNVDGNKLTLFVDDEDLIGKDFVVQIIGNDVMSEITVHIQDIV